MPQFGVFVDKRLNVSRSDLVSVLDKSIWRRQAAGQSKAGIMKMCLLIIAVVLVVGSLTTSGSVSASGLRCRQTLRIDEDCRIWWNLRVVSPDNLPQLLASDSAATGSDEYVLDIPALQELIRGFLSQRKRCVTLIVPHPGSHYVCTDNVLAVLDRLEDEFNDLKARRLNKPVDSLSGRERFSLRYAIGRWEDRDNKILVATFGARGVIDSVESSVPKEHTFEFRRSAGHWKHRESHMEGFDLPVIPKMGIPRPVKDEAPVEDGP